MIRIKKLCKKWNVRAVYTDSDKIANSVKKIKRDKYSTKTKRDNK